MMGSRNGGGPAFPRQDTDWSEGHVGMSLRDWFAGQALAGIWAGDAPVYAHKLAESNLEARAKTAYAMADAMLAEREVA